MGSDHNRRHGIATGIAQRAHVGQIRKASGLPYISHPVSVSKMAERFGYGKTAQIAALLHDVFEDISNEDRPAFEHEIKSNFPAAYRIVASLTHEPANDYITYVMGLTLSALQVKLTDMLHNLQDSPTPKQRQKYAAVIRALEEKFSGNPPGINATHWRELLLTINDSKPVSEQKLNLSII